MGAVAAAPRLMAATAPSSFDAAGKFPPAIEDNLGELVLYRSTVRLFIFLRRSSASQSIQSRRVLLLQSSILF